MIIKEAAPPPPPEPDIPPGPELPPFPPFVESFLLEVAAVSKSNEYPPEPPLADVPVVPSLPFVPAASIYSIGPELLISKSSEELNLNSPVFPLPPEPPKEEIFSFPPFPPAPDARVKVTSTASVGIPTLLDCPAVIDSVRTVV